jgi:hypothetical protein
MGPSAEGWGQLTCGLEPKNKINKNEFKTDLICFAPKVTFHGSENLGENMGR